MKGSVLGLLAICRKAGKLKMGFDAAEQCLGRDAALIVFAQDISPKTKERMTMRAERSSTEVLTLPDTADDVWCVVGKRVAVMAVIDKGLAKQLVLLSSRTEAPTRQEHEEESQL
ncbi:MAG: hypothetical protein RR135_00795 [Oscillospiraceae bacterium]